WVGGVGGGVVVVRLVEGAELLEWFRYLVVIVGDMEVTVRVRKSLVTVLLPSIGRSGVGHVCTSHLRVEPRYVLYPTDAGSIEPGTTRVRTVSSGVWTIADRVDAGRTGGDDRVASRSVARDRPLTRSRC